MQKEKRIPDDVREILAQYPFRDPEIRFLRRNENEVFAVRDGAERFVLRIQRPAEGFSLRPLYGETSPAVYLDGGIGSARKIIQRYILCREIEGLNSSRDYKTALQELVQRESGQVLKYRLTGEEGPDHDKRFFVEVDLNGTPVGSGKGHSKKEAEQMAAKAAIAKLGG